MAWHTELDDATRAYVTNKGWDKLEGDAAAQAIFKSYQVLEKARPDPAKTLVIPDASDAAATAAFYQKLGMPKTAAEYAFEGVEAESDLVDFVRDLAFKLHLPASAASDMAKSLIEFADTGDKEASEAAAKRLEDGTTALKTSWGDDYAARVATATNAFEALSLPKDSVDALISSLGVDKVMEMGYSLGSRMGEGNFLTGEGTVVTKPNTPPQTREQAIVERNRLMDDKAFAEKVANGDLESLKKINDLAHSIVGTPENWQRAPENFGRTRENPYGEPQTPTVQQP